MRPPAEAPAATPAADADITPMPDGIAPMLATPANLPAGASGWAFEVKWDGVRAIMYSEPGRLRILSRNGRDIAAAYPELRGLSAALGKHRAVIDGEIVALDEAGKPSFQLLQGRMHVRADAAVARRADATPVSYMIFDLLWIDGRSLLALPYSERRRRLELLALDDRHWRTPEAFPGEGTGLLAATRERGLEGVVGKRLDSPYVPGRHRAWIKVKNWSRQEAVIGGFTLGRGARSGRIGALLLGVHDSAGALRYAGAVGTGLTAHELAGLAESLAPLERDRTPFAGRQPPRGARFVEPEMVCEVEFSEWTRSGTLRQPTYRGLRDDLDAAAVRRERVEPVLCGDSPAGESPDLRAQIALARSVSATSRGAGHATTTVTVDGRGLRLSNLEKVLYPGTSFTKGDLIAYYASVAPVLIPHLRDRPLTLRRYPDGVEGGCFYEKRSPAHRPAWVHTALVGAGGQGRDIRYTLCQDLPTLAWLANLAAVELHPLLAAAPHPDRPVAVVFDLDPGEPAELRDCCAVALLLRELLDGLGLAAFAKTSGSKGLHVLVPLNHPAAGYSHTRALSRAVATLLEERHPDLIVSSMARSLRRGKVLIDWSQNDAHKTTASVYSMRATPVPSVSTPLAWSEVLAARNGRQLPSFGPADVLSRIAEHGDLFAKMLSLKQTLPPLED